MQAIYAAQDRAQFGDPGYQISHQSPL